MRALGLAIVATGCWASSAPAPAPTPRAPRAPFPLHSEWEGTYRCSQGATAMQLVLEATADGTLTAVFAFGPSPANPQVERGSYRQRGWIRAGREGTFHIELTPEAWIEAPDGYTMTPLTATSSRRWQRLVGKIQHPACSELDLRRRDRTSDRRGT